MTANRFVEAPRTGRITQLTPAWDIVQSKWYTRTRSVPKICVLMTRLPLLQGRLCSLGETGRKSVFLQLKFSISCALVARLTAEGLTLSGLKGTTATTAKALWHWNVCWPAHQEQDVER